jgi:hypothetical protein
MQNKPKRLTAQQIRLEQQAREMVGKRYGSFTAVEYLGLRQTSGGSWQRFLRLRCDCGAEIEASVQSVTQKVVRAAQRGETQTTMRWACDECQRRARESFAASRKHAYKPRPKTLCWSCEYAGNSNVCPWAGVGDKKRQRTDWVADRADLLSVGEARRMTVESYIVLECPGYAPDRRHR